MTELLMYVLRRDAWEQMGRDRVQPRDPQAWERLRLQREIAT